MRILLLWEWLYHFDCTLHQALTSCKADMFDTILANLALSSACRSKARKLKLLHEKNQIDVGNIKTVKHETA